MIHWVQINMFNHRVMYIIISHYYFLYKSQKQNFEFMHVNIYEMILCHYKQENYYIHSHFLQKLIKCQPNFSNFLS